VRFVSYFVPSDQYRVERAIALVHSPEQVIAEEDRNATVTIGHASRPGRMTSISQMPFSNRVFLYIDTLVSDADRERLERAADEQGIRLEIRDAQYADYVTLHEKPWAFISHDSRDKDEFVRPLADRLRPMMCPVWYDEYSLKVGDSIRGSIDKGLSDAPKCILVLSPNFLSNPGWTKGEFNAAMGKHFSTGGSVLLPIWHGVTREQVAEYSPMVADIKALRSDIDLDDLARELFVAINPT